jgi:hypothetical protein
MHKPLSEQEKAAILQEQATPFDEWLKGVNSLLVHPRDKNEFSTAYRDTYNVMLDPALGELGIIEEAEARLRQLAAESGHARRSPTALLGAFAAVCVIREERQLATLGLPHVQ